MVFLINLDQSLDSANPSFYHRFLLDVIMPEMNGDEFYKTCRNDNNTLPCIFASGYNDTIDSEVLQDNNNVRFIQKPFSQEVLISAVRDLMV